MSLNLRKHFAEVRQFSNKIAEPLTAEDCMIQSMDDVSPTRWHLAHTTWFFETFLLREEPNYQVFNPQFNYLFNSYYNTIGEQYPRSKRGLISRPGMDQIKEYRAYVDQQLLQRLESEEFATKAEKLIEIGLHHEQQHQELMLTDIKHVFSCNPLHPVYRDDPFDDALSQDLSSESWIELPSGLFGIGHSGKEFAFDNESPQHQTYLPDSSLRRSLVTCGEYLEFIDSGEYQNPEHWLSMGWATVQQNEWKAPLYWIKADNQWMHFTLAGLVPVDPEWPVTHISYFEADAFARWKGLRLPTEFEWETAEQLISKEQEEILLSEQPFVDHLLNRKKAIHPTRRPDGLMGTAWQWTSSSYAAYPGYRPPAGAVGEYNGKFMCNQYVLRGGSVATNSQHIRPTYRNFFPPEARWQFTGIRLAK